MLGMAAAGLLPIAGQALARERAIEKDKLKALMGGDLATATSELAASKAKNRMVKTFTELEIAEQVAVAKAFGSKPGAAGLSEKHSAIVKKLQAAEGAEFDLMYINGQIDGHEELLAIHKTYASSGDDPMARGASIVGATGIQSHLVMLKGIKNMLT
jgi:putative membrane protein